MSSLWSSYWWLCWLKLEDVECVVVVVDVKFVVVVVDVMLVARRAECDVC